MFLELDFDITSLINGRKLKEHFFAEARVKQANVMTHVITCHDSASLRHAIYMYLGSSLNTHHYTVLGVSLYKDNVHSEPYHSNGHDMLQRQLNDAGEYLWDALYTDIDRLKVEKIVIVVQRT